MCSAGRTDLEPGGMWLMMHEDLRSTYRIRLLFDFLATELGKLVDAR